MFDKDSGLSRYVSCIMNSHYPSSNLLNPSGFIKHANQRGLFLTEDNLEFYDKIGVLRPILRMVTPPLNGENPYHRRSFSDAGIFQLQHFYSMGLIELPTDNDFKKWSDYQQKENDRCLYYHPYQILLLDQIISEVNVEINYRIFDTEVQSIDLQSHIRQRLDWKKKSIIKLIDLVGVLILLDEYFGPLAKSEVPYNIYDTTSRFEKLRKKNEFIKSFSPSRLLLLSAMKIEEIHDYYLWLSFQARRKDPLHKWFMLQQLVKTSRRYQLTNQALLAQEYYAYLFMLANFIYDLSGKKVGDPDDVLDSQKGKWKEQVFGKPFDYTTKRTQNQILNYFLWDRPFELVFVVEGQTEEKVIELILEARGVDLEKDGFFVYNIEGVDNLLHLKPLFRVSQLIDIIIYAMIDCDKDVDKRIAKMRESAKELGHSKEIVIRKWNRDFETENFGIDNVIEKVNQILSEKGLNKVKKEDIQKRMMNSGDALIKSIENEIGRINRHKLRGKKGNNIISKPKLAALLMEERLKEIQIIDDPAWNAKLPIETELKKAFKLIPSHV